MEVERRGTRQRRSRRVWRGQSNLKVMRVSRVWTLPRSQARARSRDVPVSGSRGPPPTCTKREMWAFAAGGARAGGVAVGALEG